MKQNILILAIIAIAFSACVKDRVSPAQTGPISVAGRTLIHYWSFNTGTDSASLAVPDTTIGGGRITYSFYQNGYTDAVSPGSLLNLRRGEDTGTALRIRNPFDHWVLHIPTTGFKQPIVQFAIEKSNSGPASNAISYTTDGSTWTSTGISSSITFTTSWVLYSIDFSSISAVDDNALFAIKFSNLIADTSGGNDRYDNISVDALPK